MPARLMVHEADPRQQLLDQLGDLNEIEVFNNHVLCAVYLRPEKTASGIYLPDKNRDEDQFQSKVGLIVKSGARAFVDPNGQWFTDQEFDPIRIEEGDWVVFRPSDGWAMQINGVLCRMLEDTNIRGRVAHPDQIW